MFSGRNRARVSFRLGLIGISNGIRVTMGLR